MKESQREGRRDLLLVKKRGNLEGENARVAQLAVEDAAKSVQEREAPQGGKD